MATLDIGPGRNYQAHFDTPVVRYDLRVDVEPEVIGDARKLPFRSNSFSTVYASHVLEHFIWKEAIEILKEWWRVTAIRGELQVYVPNLNWAMLQIQHGICDEFVLNALYGRQEYEVDVHRTGFTPELLIEYMGKAVCCAGEFEVRMFRNSIMLFVRKTECLH
jgi:SAM-dependent methyltransferase